MTGGLPLHVPGTRFAWEYVEGQDSYTLLTDSYLWKMVEIISPRWQSLCDYM